MGDSRATGCASVFSLACRTLGLIGKTLAEPVDEIMAQA